MPNGVFEEALMEVAKRIIEQEQSTDQSINEYATARKIVMEMVRKELQKRHDSDSEALRISASRYRESLREFIREECTSESERIEGDKWIYDEVYKFKKRGCENLAKKYECIRLATDSDIEL